MLDELNRLVDDMLGLNRKLVLLTGPPRSGKSDLLRQLAKHRQCRVLNVSAALGRELLTFPCTQRHLHAVDLLKELVDKSVSQGLLLLDNIEASSVIFPFRLGGSMMYLLSGSDVIEMALDGAGQQVAAIRAV